MNKTSGTAMKGRPRTFDRTVALRGAMELFWQYGYEGVSMKMIESRLGLASTSVYAAFGSKEELFDEAVELYDPDGATPTDRALTLAAIRDSVEALLRNNANAYVDPSTPAGCMLVIATMNLSPGNGRMAEKLAMRRRRDAENIHQRVKRAQEDRELPGEFDAGRAAAYLVTVLHGLSVQARDGCTREQAQEIVDAALLGWDALVQQALG